jgi:hypothetical protein
MSAGVLEGAADLAGRLGAELETLFVEDIALLQWTELPFIRQVGLHGLAGTPVSPRELELQFRALAAEAQRRLAAIAALQQLGSGSGPTTNSSDGRSGSHAARFLAR